MRTAEHPAPSHLLVHISDTHLLAPDEGLLQGVVDSSGHAARLLAVVESMQLAPDALVFTGDIADTGRPEAYAAIRAMADQTAERLGARVIWCMGNHDRRETFREHLLGGAASDQPHDEVVMLGGLRVVVLDTTVPGQIWGRVEPAQLEWLREVLAEPAPEGTILAMHHPPLPCAQLMAVSYELYDQQALAEVLRGSDVRTILAGHVHHSSHGMFAGIEVSTASASSYSQDLTAPARGSRGRDAAQGFNLVQVHPETILHAVVEPAGGRTVGRELSAEQARARLAAEGIVLPE